MLFIPVLFFGEAVDVWPNLSTQKHVNPIYYIDSFAVALYILLDLIQHKWVNVLHHQKASLYSNSTLHKF